MKIKGQSEGGRRGGSSPRPSQPSVNVHIEELVLEGFASGDRHRIASAVEQELSRLIRLGGVPTSAEGPVTVTRLDAGAIHIRAGVSARATGAKIGRAVYQSLQHGRGAGATRPRQPARGVVPQ